MRRLLSTRKELPCSPRPSLPSSVSLSSLPLPCSTTHACSAENEPSISKGPKDIHPLDNSRPIRLTWCIGFCTRLKKTRPITRTITLYERTDHVYYCCRHHWRRHLTVHLVRNRLPPPHLGRVHACIFRQCDRQILQGRSLVEGCTRLRNLILDRVSRDGCRRCRKNSTRSLTLKSPLTILTYNPKTWVIGFLETPP